MMQRYAHVAPDMVTGWHQSSPRDDVAVRH
jgi:hypothetical protein